jgi:hypothetical protein
MGTIDPHEYGLFREAALTIVVVQTAIAVEIIEKQVGVAIVVVVDPGAALADAGGLALDAGNAGDVFERAIALVAVKTMKRSTRPSLSKSAHAAALELTGARSPAVCVTSINPPLPLLRKRLGRIATGSHAPRAMKRSIQPSLSKSAW